MGVYFHKGPAFGELGWAFLSSGLLIRGTFIRSFRDMQMPCRQVSLFIGAPMGNLEGVCLLGLLREKKYYIWVPFLDPEVIKILSLGATAPMIRYGAQRARLLRPRCIGAETPQTQLLICPPTHPPTYLSVCLSAYLSIFHSFIHIQRILKRLQNQVDTEIVDIQYNKHLYIDK